MKNAVKDIDINKPYAVSSRGNALSFKKLVARLNNVATVGNGIFMGYCKTHKRYYLDRKHTNGNIRCPHCDAIWLRKMGFIR